MTKKKIIDKLQTPKAVKWFWIILVSPVALIVLLLLLIRLGVFGKLPTFEELENPKSNLATEIYSEDGQMIGSFFVQNRSYVDYSELSLLPFRDRFHFAGPRGRQDDGARQPQSGRRQHDYAAVGQKSLPARYGRLRQPGFEGFQTGDLEAERVDYGRDAGV